MVARQDPSRRSVQCVSVGGRISACPTMFKLLVQAQSIRCPAKNLRVEAGSRSSIAFANRLLRRRPYFRGAERHCWGRLAISGGPEFHSDHRRHENYRVCNRRSSSILRQLLAVADFDTIRASLDRPAGRQVEQRSPQRLQPLQWRHVQGSASRSLIR